MSVTLLHKPAPALTDREKAQRNEDAAIVLIDHECLPALKVMGLPSAAHVNVASYDDLLLWQEKVGGDIVEHTPVVPGMAHATVTWTLHTATDHPNPARCVAICVVATGLIETASSYTYGVAA